LSRNCKVILFLAALILCLCPVMTTMAEEAAEETVETTAAEIPEEYVLKAENDRFEMYLREDTLGIILKSKATGGMLKSVVDEADSFKAQGKWATFCRSGVVLEYIEDVQSTNSQADLAGNAHEMTIDDTENGFTAHIKFTDIGISFDMSVTLEEGGVCVKIPQDSIAEENSEKYTTAGFCVYPFMGYTELGDTPGYMIIPDGQGAIIELKDYEGRFSTPFDGPVYGTNIGVDGTVNTRSSLPAEQIVMPVFGMVHTEDQIACLGVIEEGDCAARITAYMNGAIYEKFNWVCARYVYRRVYQQPTGPSSGAISARTEFPRNFDICQHFLLTDGEEATYAGLACAWREYMTEKGMFENAAEREFDVRLEFLGLEKENFILGKQDVVMTTYAQAKEILEELKSGGVETMNVSYRGWQENGESGGKPTDSFSPAGALGGKNGLTELREAAEEMGAELSLEADFLTLCEDTHPVLGYSAMKMITSQTWNKPSFGEVYDTIYYLKPARSKEIAESVLKAMADGGMKGVTLTGITSLMFDWYDGGYHDSAELQEIYRGIAENASEQMDVTLETANAYLWGAAGALSDLPLSGSDYTYVSREVPFLAIALSGKIPYYAEYVNDQANTRHTLLHLAEQGARPCFLLTMEDPQELQHTNSSDVFSSKYELYREMIIEWYGELKELNDKVSGESIVRHDTEGDMTCVTWSNGVKVYLNFGDAEGEMDGVKLESLTWSIEE